MEVDQFISKLNKVDGNIYVIEETAILVDGVYENLLEHDNINPATLNVYTGSKLTGTKVDTYALSTPSLTPWKRSIRIYSTEPKVFISYETDGDTVEAEDINHVQESISHTQAAVNEEISRAGKAEEDLEKLVVKESERAQAEEKGLDQRLTDEISRSENAEMVLSDQILAECNRAKGEESRISSNLDKETARAEAREEELQSALHAETARAEAKEKELKSGIDTEAARAKAAEASLKSTIDTNKPKWDDKYTKNEVDNKFSTLETAIDWKESVATFATIATIYPSPVDGWTVNVKDTDYTYRYNGSAWIAISANAIPKATSSVDGLLSKEDKSSYDDANAKKHIHNNKAVLDKVTQTLLDNLSSAYTHTSNKANPHGVTAAQVGLGNTENKNGVTIRSEMTKEEVVKALGYTPPTSSVGYTHPNSGVTAGTYRSMTVNAQGHVTAGTNPTTLAGYGITDSAAKTHEHSELAPTVSSSNTSSVSANKYCKLATMKISSRYGYVSRTYEVIVGAHGSTNNDYLRLNVWFKQQEAFGGSPYVYLSVFTNDSTIERIRFYAVVDELNSAYTQISLYVKIISTFTSCILYTVAKTESGGNVIYINNSGFVDTLPATGTIINQVDYTNHHTHPASAVTPDATHRFATDTEKNTWNGKAAGNHNHDTVYMKKGPVTWNHLKGV